MQPSRQPPRRLSSLLCCANVDVLQRSAAAAQHDDDDWRCWRSITWSQPLPTPSRPVASVAFGSPPPPLLPCIMTACAAGEVVFMTCDTGTLVSCCSLGSKGGGSSTCACGDGIARAWVGTRDGSIFCVALPLPSPGLSSAAAAATPQHFKAHKSAVTSCCFAADVLYTAANRVRGWTSSSSSSSSSSSMTMLCEIDLSSRVVMLFPPPDCPHLWACCDDGRISVLSRDLKLISNVLNSKSSVTCITSIASPSLTSTSLIWAGRSDGTLHACASSVIVLAKTVTRCADNPYTLGNLVSLKLGSSSITSLFPSNSSYLSVITAARRIITVDSSYPPPPPFPCRSRAM
jgi:hypothetical protein